MNFTELAKFKHAQYSKVGAYQVSELVETQDESFFFSTDSSGIKRIHKFSNAGATITLAEAVATKAENILAKAEEESKVKEKKPGIIKSVKEKITKKKDK